MKFDICFKCCFLRDSQGNGSADCYEIFASYSTYIGEQ